MSMTLLIVDDHDMMREGLRYAFDGTEIEVVEAANGHTALRRVLDEEVDVVLLDIDMPDLDGLEVLKRIKQQEPDLPVLMHSYHDRVAYVQRSIELGAVGYITALSEEKDRQPSPYAADLVTQCQNRNNH